MLVSSKYPDEASHRDLKEKLYYDIIGHFDQGKVNLKTFVSLTRLK